ncbi:MAG: FixH family protein [Hyphomicrobiaceae bacterium]|nr:FixH family protein [Hyphomicrobiaceae bacterium]
MVEPSLQPKVITGRHVLFGMIAFFAVIFAVNGWFLYSALSTYTGVVSNEPYRKGLAYNERIAADTLQHERGWTASLSLAGENRGIVVALADQAGDAVVGLTLRGNVGRPSTNDSDVVLTFAEIAPGRYVAIMEPLAAGNWVADVEAASLTSSGEEIVWRMRQRVWVKP